MPGVLNLQGQRFGRLTVIARSSAAPATTGNRSVKWEARCDCGTTITVRACSLSSGNTTSCGCSRRTHGQSRTQLYQLWSTMIARCERPTATSYLEYGGRGIRVCQRWRESFEAFTADMGPRPSKQHTLDRFPDVNGNYEPGNVRWAPMTLQQRNKRNNHRLTIGNETMTLVEWSERTGVKYTTLKERLRRGWAPSLAVTP